jgi:subtilase family serine protease
MDLDAVSALCPNCKIDLVEASSASAQDLQAAIVSAISAGANQVSISGAGEFSSNPFTDFSAPNVSIVAAAGDAGVIPAGYANYPAALPWVTAVGGTSLQPDSASAVTPRGVTESVWSGSGSGCDTQEQPLAYQPNVGCAGRIYSDVSADADPSTGLSFYDSQAGGWLDGGGTSLATPLTAAFEAVTGVNGSTSQWAYTDAPELNQASTGSTGPCTGLITVLCTATGGYSGPTGAGSISGQVTTGAPGIGEPALGQAESKTYVQRVTDTGAYLLGGVYPNGEETSYYWQYGPTRSYGYQSKTRSAGSGSDPVATSGRLVKLAPGTTYHYRLVAVNASGTTYGYDYTLRTAPAIRSARVRRARA